MKKTQTKKLTLKKITIAQLDSADLKKAVGGQMAYTKASVCMEQCCVSDYCW